MTGSYAAALLIYRAAWAKDSGTARVTREAAMAKLFATEMAQRVIDRAVQVHGGLGVTKGVIESVAADQTSFVVRRANANDEEPKQTFRVPEEDEAVSPAATTRQAAQAAAAGVGRLNDLRTVVSR